MSIMIGVDFFHFNPLAPRGARPSLSSLSFKARFYFNPLAPRGARLRRQQYGVRSLRYFNPLAPRGARRAACPYPCWKQCDFNPLAPRGARPRRTLLYSFLHNISIHSPLAGRDVVARGAASVPRWISIHSPLAGRDGRAAVRIPVPSAFQSTRPSRGETPDDPKAKNGYV